MSLSDGILPRSKLLRIEDVKQFIKELKEEAKKYGAPSCKNGLTWTEFIDELAGEGLI